MQLKRLWDTDGKKIVFTEGPTGHQCQVWTDESGNLYIYDMAQWLAYNGTTPAGKEYDRSNWVELTDQTVGFYDTNEATDLYHWDHGDDAYYEFVDWDGTVLKSGTVIEGGTPTAPADPTRPSTEEYTYTFAGWEPAVGPITKRTTYTATYTAIRTYTLSFEPSIEGAGYFTDDITGQHVVDSVTVDEGTKIWGAYSGLGAKSLIFGEKTTIPFDIAIQQHANSGYNFVKFTCNGEDVPTKGSEPIGTVEGDMAYVAVYEPKTYTVTVQSNNTSYGTVSPTSVVDVPHGTTVTVNSNTITIGETTVTATAESGCSFVNWSDAPATITGNVTITANFQSDTPAPTLLNNATIDESNTGNLIFFNGTGSTGGIVYDVTQDQRIDNINAGGSAGLLSILQDEVNALVGSASFGQYCRDSVGYFTSTAWEYLEAVYENDSAANIAAAKTYIESASGDVFTGTQPTPPTPTGDYRYIKWHVTGTWDTGDPSDQLYQIMASRFVLTDGVNEMTYPVSTTASTNGTNDGSDYSETPANLLDGSTSTKMVVGWLESPYSPLDVIIDLGSGNGFDPTEYDHYQWYTANDSFGGPEVYRNPVSWEIQLSEDGTTWETWDTQTNATLVEENQVAAGTWSLTAPL